MSLFYLRTLILVFFLPLENFCFAADYVSPEDRQANYTKQQTVVLVFFMGTFILLGGYAIWLHQELARVTLQRIFGTMITTPLLSSQQDQNQQNESSFRTTTPSDNENVELQYRQGDYQGPQQQW